MTQQFLTFARPGIVFPRQSVTIHGNWWSTIANSKKGIGIDWYHAKLDNPNEKTRMLPNEGMQRTGQHTR